MKYCNYELRNVRGHVEVFLDGQFQFSADTKTEAIREINNESEGNDREVVRSA